MSNNSVSNNTPPFSPPPPPTIERLHGEQGQLNLARALQDPSTLNPEAPVFNPRASTLNPDAQAYDPRAATGGTRHQGWWSPAQPPAQRFDQTYPPQYYQLRKVSTVQVRVLPDPQHGGSRVEQLANPLDWYSIEQIQAPVGADRERMRTDAPNTPHSYSGSQDFSEQSPHSSVATQRHANPVDDRTGARHPSPESLVSSLSRPTHNRQPHPAGQNQDIGVYNSGPPPVIHIPYGYALVGQLPTGSHSNPSLQSLFNPGSSNQDNSNQDNAASSEAHRETGAGAASRNKPNETTTETERGLIRPTPLRPSQF